MNMLRLDKAIRLKPTTLVNSRRLASGHGHGHKDDHGHGHGHDDHGHDDHHHHEPFEVPHYSQYNNWTVSPELVAHQQRLNAIGLHDPWIRNLTWAYRPEYRKHWGNPKLMKVLFGGLPHGIVTAAVLILLTEGWIYYHKEDAHDHHHHQEHH